MKKPPKGEARHAFERISEFDTAMRALVDMPKEEILRREAAEKQLEARPPRNRPLLN